jgi:NAD-dependent DNA ligase
VYDALDQNLNAFDTFKLVDEHFESPNWITMVVDCNIEERLKEIFEVWKNVGKYMMDGLVISTADYVNEDVYHPERKIAFKVNSEGVKTTVKGIEWNISKGGLLKPVVLVEATEIDGTTVQRVTGFNAKYILDKKIGTGTVVSIIKSGEIIPKIVKVW